MLLDLIYKTHLHSKKETKALDNLPPFGLIRYVDSNYVSDPKNKKLVMDHCFFFYKAVISWCNKKQCTISTSTIKAKYIALRHTARKSI